VRDTHPDVERVRIDLLRRAGLRGRATLASNLTNRALGRARRGIALANPHMSELERKLLFVEVHYGRDLATRLRDWLRARSRG
jgi:hypothetical protein